MRVASPIWIPCTAPVIRDLNINDHADDDDVLDDNADDSYNDNADDDEDERLCFFWLVG